MLSQSLVLIYVMIDTFEKQEFYALQQVQVLQSNHSYNYQVINHYQELENPSCTVVCANFSIVKNDIRGAEA